MLTAPGCASLADPSLVCLAFRTSYMLAVLRPFRRPSDEIGLPSAMRATSFTAHAQARFPLSVPGTLLVLSPTKAFAAANTVAFTSPSTLGAITPEPWDEGGNAGAALLSSAATDDGTLSVTWIGNTVESLRITSVFPLMFCSSD